MIYEPNRSFNDGIFGAFETSRSLRSCSACSRRSSFFLKSAIDATARIVARLRHGTRWCFFFVPDLLAWLAEPCCEDPPPFRPGFLLKKIHSFSFSWICNLRLRTPSFKLNIAKKPAVFALFGCFTYCSRLSRPTLRIPTTPTLVLLQSVYQFREYTILVPLSPFSVGCGFFSFGYFD